MYSFNIFSIQYFSIRQLKNTLFWNILKCFFYIIFLQILPQIGILKNLVFFNIKLCVSFSLLYYLWSLQPYLYSVSYYPTRCSNVAKFGLEIEWQVGFHFKLCLWIFLQQKKIYSGHPFNSTSNCLTDFILFIPTVLQKDNNVVHISGTKKYSTKKPKQSQVIKYVAEYNEGKWSLNLSFLITED